MTDAPMTPLSGETKPNLDIGGVISSTFKVFSRQFPYFFSVLFFPYLGIQLLFTFGFGMAELGTDPFILQSDNGGAFIALTLVSVLIFWFGFLMIQAVIVRSAVSVKLNRGVEFSAAIRAGLAGLIPIIVLGLVATIVAVAGFIALIVPGLYVLAMFYVLIPVIVFENRGFGGLGRSIELTSGYRWSIVGLILVLMIIGMLAGLVIGILSAIIIGVMAAAGGDFIGLQTSPVFLLAFTVLDALMNAIIYPITMIATAMAYVRLREIKDGGETSDLLKVFE